MLKRKTAVRVGLIGALALGSVVFAQNPASADPAPSDTDVVGVGSDIVQNSVDFLADGLGSSGGGRARDRGRPV